MHFNVRQQRGLPPADPFEFWKELTCTQPQSGETANRPAKVEPAI
jgi:hypothetical protein